MNETAVTLLDEHLDVRQRLQDLYRWHEEWKTMDEQMQHRISELGRTAIDIQKAAQIGNLRRRLRLQQVRRPLEIDPGAIKRIGYDGLRQRFVEQFVRLSKEERLMWLNNFVFIMTPDIRRLNDKIAKVREYRSFGQQRNFLLGGESGMGKTTYLEWFTSHYTPAVEKDYTHVPIIKIDAPEGNSPKPLFQRIILACGMNYLNRDHEEDLLMKISLYFQQCSVEVVIIDEIEHIKNHSIRRRVLELSNMTYGVPIICASCSPHQWVEGDSEIAGRWNDYFRLQPYTGKRLQQLLLFINLLLPFTQNSFSGLYHKKPSASSAVEENAFDVIRDRTRGTLRDIMLLTRESSKYAIEHDLPYIDAALLDKTWKSIQTDPLKRSQAEQEYGRQEI